ncbi:mannosylfructose-phosphate synthase [Peptococcaceae bacterium CEB3]|nr:mannosylfructose-phosphate synthase [Peptococcaceae bacterium CEB3]
MNILIDGTSVTGSKSGVGYYTVNLIRGLATVEGGPKLTVMVPRGTVKSELAPAAQFVDARKWYLRHLPCDTLNLSGRYDIYHEPNFVPRPFKGATIVTIHDMSYRLFPQYHPLRRVMLMRASEGRMKKADQIITVSESSKRDIVELLGVRQERITVTHLGVDKKFKKMDVSGELSLTVQKMYGLPKRFILCVGTIEPRKNLLRLIEAYAWSRTHLASEGIKLVLAGGRGWLNDEIYQRIEQLNLADEVIFTGYVKDEDMPTLYNSAIVFVYPSVYEGFGLPPLEAMACGVPVITSNVSSLPEVVGDAGIMVDPYDIEELGEAIVRVVSSTELRENLSGKGIRRASQFTWERCARETLAVYEECYKLRT